MTRLDRNAKLSMAPEGLVGLKKWDRPLRKLLFYLMQHAVEGCPQQSMSSWGPPRKFSAYGSFAKVIIIKPHRTVP